MKGQRIMNASDIKGYCTLDACWRFLHDMSSRLVQSNENGLFCTRLSLNDVRINENEFIISDECLSTEGSAHKDVWMLAAAAFELIMGSPVFNGLGEKAQTEKTPLPNLQGKDMHALNSLLHRCMQKDSSKRPDMRDVRNLASEELDKCMKCPRKPRIYSGNNSSLTEGEYDRKWPEHILNLKVTIICLLLMISSQAFCQSFLDKEKEAYTLELMEAAKTLRIRTEESWNKAQADFSLILDSFTMMDELSDIDNDCALAGKSVDSFGLNRMISMLKRSRTVVQNTGKGLLDGTDLRFHYSIYEKGIRQGCTATYDGLSGRAGKQVFIIIPYSADQPYETELSLESGRKYTVTHKDKEGIIYYLIDTMEGPEADDSLVLKICNKDSQNNRSFVIINHNYRDK